MSPQQEFRRSVLRICALGVALRLLFLGLVEPLEFHADEANYLYMALSWNHFGFYSDSFRYLWPPGYPYVLATALAWFEHAGPLVVKLLQCLASASIGASTMLIARELFDRRAATWAGLAWCFYLPLIGFSHYLWAETLFLALLTPALYLLLRLTIRPPQAIDLSLIAAGLLFAAALYTKEVALFLAPLLAMALLWNRELALSERARRALLFLAVVAVVVTPWSLRNREVYGRTVGIGTSLGENAFHGLNATYTNFELLPFVKQRSAAGPAAIATRSWWVDADPSDAWRRAIEIPNTADRLSENLRRGVDYASGHPGWFVRSRVKKAADLLTPTSFFVRHQALGKYRESLIGRNGPRQLTSSAAVLMAAAAMALAIPGLLLALRDPRARAFVGLVLVYFLATSLVVAMSRFRLPMMPWLLALAAGTWTRWDAVAEASRAGKIATGAALAVLAFLWWVDLPELLSILGSVWSAA